MISPSTSAARAYPLAHVNYGSDEIAAVVETLTAKETTCGKRVAAFEDAFAQYVGRRHAIMVNSGSSADLLLAFALDHQAGQNEILVPAVTWPTQIWSCVMAGYKVRLVDVDLDTLQMSMDDLSDKISHQTRAIFMTHLMGNVCGAETYGWANIPVLEDCCEALGARNGGKHVGTSGASAAFSFFFSHHITTMEGGMVVTDSDWLARKFRLLRSHGWEPQPDCRFYFPEWGFNVRPMEVQGAFGLPQLGKLDVSLAARAANAERLAGWTHRYYPEHLQGMTVLADVEPSWHGFPLLCTGTGYTRDTFLKYLDRHNIETRPIVAGNFAKQPAARKFRDKIHAGKLPNADRVHERGFYIGVAPFDDPAGCQYVAEVFSDFFKNI